MRRVTAALVFAALLLFTTAWTLEDCIEVDYDHPDCDKYTTTTTVTTPSTTTTTEAPSTTTTVTSPNETTTTVTQPETPTTAPVTTTTRQECPPGTVHQPPLCVTTTIPHFETTTTTQPDQVASSARELPHTGAPLLLLAGLMAGGFVVGPKFLKWARRPD